MVEPDSAVLKAAKEEDHQANANEKDDQRAVNQRAYAEGVS